jgi:hypothetical protein
MIRFAARLSIIATGLVFASFSPQAIQAEVILGPAPSGTIPSYYWRFSGGYTDDPTLTVNNPTFYQSGLDLSGVGWRLPGNGGVGGGEGWNVAMIDSQHFIGAWHVHLGGTINIGETVNFRPSNSATAIVQRTIANLQQVPNGDGTFSDVMLGTLSAPFTALDHIAAYPIAASPLESTYFQMPFFVYGRSSELGRNNFSDAVFGPGNVVNVPGTGGPTTVFGYDYDTPTSNPDGNPSTVGPDESHLEIGDSGGPSLIMIGGQLQLIGDHLAVSTDIFSIDSFLPFYTGQIIALTVPEPSSLILVGLTTAGAVAGYVRSRRRPAAK